MLHRLAVLACIGLFGCGGSEAKQEPKFLPASTERPADENNGICFAALTKARCDHDEGCGFVDSGKRFGDRDACLNHYNGIGYKSLEACSTRIDRNQLRQCLASIRTASCESPIADIGTIDACNFGTLCRAMP